MAAQGVHASPTVTTSCHVDEYLCFLVEGAWAALQGGAAIGTRTQVNFLGHIYASYAQHSRRKTHQAWLETKAGGLLWFEATLGLPSEF